MNRTESAASSVLDAYRGESVLVLGAAGFIGRSVAAALAVLGADVTAFVRDPHSAPVELASSRAIRVVGGDVLDESHLASLMTVLRPSVTFNLAGYGVRPGEDDPDTSRRVNTAFPITLARLVAEARNGEWRGNALVHAGTQAEYGPVGVMEERVEGVPGTLYGRTKLAGTLGLCATAKELELPAVVARVFNVYGPGEPAHRLLPMLIDRARDQDPIELTSAVQKRDFCYVGDVAQGMLRLGAIQPLFGEPVNLATGDPLELRNLVTAAAQQLHISTARLRFGALPDRSEEVPSPAVSARRLEELTGWLPPTSLEVGIRQTVAVARQSSSAEQR